MPTTFNVFFLGNFASIDTVEGNGNAENAAALVGQTIGGSGTPLYSNINQFSPGTTGFTAGGSSVYDTDNAFANNTFSIDGGADQTFDGYAIYNITVTYTDGSTATIKGLIFQDTAGSAYLAPTTSTGNADQDGLEARAIESISIDSIFIDSGVDGMFADRAVGDYLAPDGTVVGEQFSEDMAFDNGYQDANGDFISNTEGDTIYGLNGDDTIRTGGGDDRLVGGQGNDSLLGGTGNDQVEGGDQDDTLLGGDGNDYLTAGPGSDSVLGEAGNDTLELSGDDFYDGGDGTDVLDATFSTFAETITFNADNSGNTGLNNSTFQNIEVFNSDGGADSYDASAATGPVTISTGADNDTIIGGFGHDSIDGGTGDDVLTGSEGNDTVLGDAGSDTIVLADGHGNDSVDGGVDGGLFADELDASGITASGVTVDMGSNEQGTLTSSGGTVTFDEIETFTLTNQGDDYDGNFSNADISVDAGAGDDTLTEGTGDSTLIGGAGADLFNLGNGDATVQGGDSGADIDTVSFSLANDTTDAVSVVFTSSGVGAFTSLDGDDGAFSQIEAFQLTGYNDFLDGRADAAGLNVQAGAGDDSVLGGTGADTIIGGLGSDTIEGGDGDDYIDGGDGDDLLRTGAGQDTLLGGEGNDTLLNSVGDDSLVGGAGDDSIVATWGNDTLEGGTGNDTLIGGADDDSVEGGAGDDTIFSGSRNIPGAYSEQTGTSDSFTGTGGNGDFTGTTTSSDGQVSSFTSGGLSGYWLGNGDGIETHTHSFSQDVAGARIDFNALNSGEYLSFEIDGFPVDLNTLIANGDAVFDGANAYGIDGSGKIIETGPAGNSTIGSITFLRPFTEIDVISSVDTAGSGLVYEMHVDTNPPTFSDDDFLSGGDDADTFIIENAFGNDTIIGGEGGNDNDVIDMNGLSGPVTVTYDSIGAESGTITDGIDTITFSEIERIVLTDQDDSVDASASHNGEVGDAIGINVEGRGGDDTIIGGRGGDTIDGGTGADSIDGDYGDDSLTGGDGNDTIFGDGENGSENGNDTIDGGAGDDSIEGGNQSDSLMGGAGNDTINGGAADNDTIDGGTGSDTFLLDDNYGGDNITGGEDLGNADVDVIDASGVTADGIDVFLSGNEAGSVTSTQGTVNFSQIESFTLTDQADSFAGGNSNADQTVDGGGGDDTITGGAGDDSLAGGTGKDVLTGGGGDDVFTFNVGDGADTITDFNTGNSGALGDGDTTNNDFIDLSQYYTNLAELRADFADDGVLNQSDTLTSDYSDNTTMNGGDGITFSGADQSSFTADNTGVVCFTSGTAIRTPLGDVLIDALRIGDLVSTMDNGAKRIRWIGRSSFGAQSLHANSKLRPVLIPKGVMGAERNLLVSRQHALLMDRDHLVRATHLADVKGLPVRVAHGKKQVTYIHLMFDAHEVIFAENVAAESFYPGPMALSMMKPDVRAEMSLIFPDIERDIGQCNVAFAYGSTARRVLKRKEVPLNAGLAGKKTSAWGGSKSYRPLNAQLQDKTLSPAN